MQSKSESSVTTVLSVPTFCFIWRSVHQIWWNLVFFSKISYAPVISRYIQINMNIYNLLTCTAVSWWDLVIRPKPLTVVAENSFIYKKIKVFIFLFKFELAKNIRQFTATDVFCRNGWGRHQPFGDWQNITGAIPKQRNVLRYSIKMPLAESSVLSTRLGVGVHCTMCPSSS